MPEVKTCPSCGAELSEGAPCWACLLAIALKPDKTLLLPIPPLEYHDLDENIVDLTGHCFDDYEVLEKIGEGGMGEVYKARQLSLDRIVALKTILSRAKTIGDSDTQRFHREARAVASLQHPNILPVFGSGKYKDRNYFTM